MILVREQTITTVDQFVRNNVTYAGDNDLYGRPYMAKPIETMKRKKGDCEDFCLVATQQLHEVHGVPLSVIHWALVHTEGREGRFNHQVCIVASEFNFYLTCADTYSFTEAPERFDSTYTRSMRHEHLDLVACQWWSMDDQHAGREGS